ncbi:MAG: hypothetical protein HYZ53_00055 [Planctomycetes bacterium]|nr:hypothetical protein [Planctomycetota bacterium]
MAEFEEPVGSPPTHVARALPRRVLLHFSQALRHLHARARLAWIGWKARLRRREADRLCGALGREAWSRLPDLGCSPYSEELGRFDARVRVLSGEIEQLERLVAELNAERARTAASWAARLGQQDAEVRAATDRLAAADSALTRLERDRVSLEEELSALEEERARSLVPGGTIGAGGKPAATANGPAAVQGPDGPPVGVRAELGPGAVRLRERLEDLKRRHANAEADAAPVRDALKAARAERDRLALERDKALRDLDVQSRAYCEQSDLRRIDREDVEAKKAPLFVQLGLRLFETRERADLLGARFEEIARAREVVAAIEAETAVLGAGMSALPRAARLTSGVLVASPLLLAALVAWHWLGRGPDLSTPERAFASVYEAVARRDWGGLYDLFSAGHQQAFASALDQLRKDIDAAPEPDRPALVRFSGLDPERWRTAGPREYFVGFAASHHGEAGATTGPDLGGHAPDLRSAEIVRVELRGERAAVLFRRRSGGSEGAEERLPFLRERGGWRFDSP